MFYKVRETLFSILYETAIKVFSRNKERKRQQTTRAEKVNNHTTTTPQTNRSRLYHTEQPESLTGDHGNMGVAYSVAVKLKQPQRASIWTQVSNTSMSCPVLMCCGHRRF